MIIRAQLLNFQLVILAMVFFFISRSSACIQTIGNMYACHFWGVDNFLCVLPLLLYLYYLMSKKDKKLKLFN